MLSEKQAFKDLANFAKSLKEYFALKNKILWESSSDWDTGAKTIDNISKYQSILVYTSLGNYAMRMERQHDGVFVGSTVVVYPEWHATLGMTLYLGNTNGIANDDTTITINWLDHNTTTGHGPATSSLYGVKKIIGLEPYLPESLQNFLGGGYCIGVKRRRRLPVVGYTECHGQQCHSNPADLRLLFIFLQLYRKNSRNKAHLTARRCCYVEY